MNLICPNCKYKKNGKTYYGKQNHKCKDCGRQFVLNNNHNIDSAVKTFIFNALKERNSLRSLCRIFGVSLTWLMSFAQRLWDETPQDLGISSKMCEKIEELQVFGIQMDELWSFVGKKTKKRWIWVVYDPMHRLVIAHYIGGRGKPAAKKLSEKSLLT